MAAPLPHDIQTAVDQAVRSGRYRSEHDVLREAIALLNERDAALESRIDGLVDAVAEARRDVAAGRYRHVSLEEMKQLARESLAELGD